MTESQKKSMKMLDGVVPQAKKMRDILKTQRKLQRSKKMSNIAWKHSYFKNPRQKIARKRRDLWDIILPFKFLIMVEHTQGIRGKRVYKKYFESEGTISIPDLKKWINKKIIPIVKNGGKIHNVGFRFTFLTEADGIWRRMWDLGMCGEDLIRPFGGHFSYYADFNVNYGRIYSDNYRYTTYNEFYKDWEDLYWYDGRVGTRRYKEIAMRRNHATKQKEEQK